jgi:hypothetical protein
MRLDKGLEMQGIGKRSIWQRRLEGGSRHLALARDSVDQQVGFVKTRFSPALSGTVFAVPTS